MIEVAVVFIVSIITIVILYQIIILIIKTHIDINLAKLCSEFKENGNACITIFGVRVELIDNGVTTIRIKVINEIMSRIYEKAVTKSVTNIYGGYTNKERKK